MNLSDLLPSSGLSGLSGIALAFAIGLVGGTLYFTGLWWTVRRLADQRLSTPGLIASWLVRLLALMGALWWAMHTSADRLPALLAAVIGVLVARTVILRRVRAVAAPVMSTSSSAARASARPGSPTGTDER